MARDYGSQLVNYCEIAGWESSKRVLEDKNTAVYETNSSDVKGNMAQNVYEAQNGAVQKWTTEVRVEDKGHEKGKRIMIQPLWAGLIHHATVAKEMMLASTTDERLENVSPKITILPIPSRLRMYVPPTNFGAVEEGFIYRSGYPQPKNYSFLESLNLKTILTLVPEPLSKEYLEFIHAHRIRHVQIHIPANKDGVIKITPERMCMALSVVLDRRHHPLLIHCNRGKHRTGCVTACLRKVQTVVTEAAIAEYRDYSSPKSREDDMTFIRAFEPAMMLPYARSKGWPLTPPPEPTDDAWLLNENETDGGVVFTLEDIAACKLPEDMDESL